MYREYRLWAFLFILMTTCPWVHGQSDAVSVYIRPSPASAPALTVVNYDLRVKNTSLRILDSLKVTAATSELYDITLYDNTIERLIPGRTIRIPIQIRTKFRVTTRFEHIRLFFKAEGISDSHTVGVQLNPHPVFWPAVGVLLGAGVIWLFIWIFMRLNKEE